ncbi:MAG: OB-fold domain-containing protein [Patescibacteria group bacterium]|nr:OB-fold domain-containing protein [Patescibacteria group bacterium]
MKSSIKIWREKEERYVFLSKIGRVVSFTKIHEAPKGFRSSYIVVMVEVENGERVVGQLVGDVKQSIKIGDKVIGVLRKLREPEKKEVIKYGVKWKKI